MSSDKLWCVKMPSGRFNFLSVSITRLGAIDKAGQTCIPADDYRSSVFWKKMYRQGFRCLRVRLVEGWRP